MAQWSVRVQNALAALPRSEEFAGALATAGLSGPDWSLLVTAYLCEPPFTLADLSGSLPYTAPEAVESRLQGLLTRAYVRRVATAEYLLTDKAAELLQQWSDKERSLLAGTHPLPARDLKRLAELLERVVAAGLAAAYPPQKPRLRGSRRLAPAANAAPMARIDQALTDLYYYRDDCHMTAWRATGLDGPAVEVLTRLWRGEVQDVETASASLTERRGYDSRYYARLVQKLAGRGLLEPAGSDTVLTASGRELREGIEAATEQYYMAPWTVLPPLQLRQLGDLLTRFTRALQPPA